MREAKRKARSELDARKGWNSQGLAKAFEKRKWDFHDNVERVDARTISKEDFVAQYEKVSALEYSALSTPEPYPRKRLQYKN